MTLAEVAGRPELQGHTRALKHFAPGGLCSPLTFITDPGHGWLKVTVGDIEALA